MRKMEPISNNHRHAPLRWAKIIKLNSVSSIHLKSELKAKNIPRSKLRPRRSKPAFPRPRILLRIRNFTSLWWRLFHLSNENWNSRPEAGPSTGTSCWRTRPTSRFKSCTSLTTTTTATWTTATMWGTNRLKLCWGFRAWPGAMLEPLSPSATKRF